MSELLVPIAISSQLDVTGEERIHSAPYQTVTRPIYVPAPFVPANYLAMGDTSVSSPSNQLFTGLLGGVFTEVPAPDFNSNANATAGAVRFGDKIFFAGQFWSGEIWEADVSDLASWTARTIPFAGAPVALQTNGDRLLIARTESATSTGVSYSDDGNAWSSVAPVSGIAPVSPTQHSVPYGNGRFAMVGTNNSSSPTAGVFAHSTDAESWSVETITTDVGSCRFISCVWTGSAWLAGNNNGEIWRSTNRTTWTKVLATGTPFNSTYQPQMCAALGDGRVVFIGWSGVPGTGNVKVSYSGDHGLTWTTGIYAGTSLSTHVAAYEGFFWTGDYFSEIGDLWDEASLSNSSFTRFDALVPYD